MRRTLAILCLLAGLAAAPLVTHAQNISAAQELFVGAFLNDRKGEELIVAGDLKGSMQAYRSAADSLAQIKQQFPTWQKELVDFRLGRVNKAIADLQAKPEMKSANMAPAPGPGGVPMVEEGGNPLFPNPGNRPGPLPPPPGSEELTPNDPLAPGAEITPGPAPVRNSNPGRAPKPAAPIGNPLEAISKELDDLRNSNAEKDATVADLRNTVKELTLAESAARKVKEKALSEKKEATDLYEVVKREYHELKNKKDGNEERVKELETKMAKVEADKATANAELVAAEERIKQLLDRTKATVVKIKDAGAYPAKIKKLEAELAEEKTARTTLEEKLKGVEKERDTAIGELARLKDANKETDKLMADNANLLKKLADTEKQIQQFQADIPKKDAEIALLKKQMVETQKALAVSQEKNNSLQTEIGDLRKKMDEYSKQVASFKNEKAVGVEERRKLDEENKLLQGIVMRVLQEDANRSQRKKMVQKEMERLHIQSDILIKQVSLLSEPVVKLTNAERRLFKKPMLDVQSPNDLIMVLPGKPENGAGPAPSANPLQETPGDAKAPNVATEPLPTPDPEKPEKSTPAAPPPAKPLEVASANPTKNPDLPAPEAPPAEHGNGGIGNSTGGFNGLPAEVKPLAEQAKKAFEGEDYAEAEKIYQKAMLVAPNNLYVVSNLGVTQFRSKKYKNAEESFRRAITIAPEDHFSWCTLEIGEQLAKMFLALKTLPAATATAAIEFYSTAVREYSPSAADLSSWMNWPLDVQWQLLARSAVTAEVLRELSPSFFSREWSESAAQLFRRADFEGDVVADWMAKNPDFRKSFSPEFFLAVLDALSGESKIKFILEADEAQWQAAREPLLELLQNDGAARGSFWDGALGILGQGANSAARILNDEAIARTFLEIAPDAFLTLLQRSGREQETLVLRWLEAHGEELPQGSETLIAAATHETDAFRLWGLRRVRTLGLNVPVALRLMESGLPQPFALGREYFESAARESGDEADYALALCDSPNAQVRTYGREYIARRASSLLNGVMLQNLTEHFEPEMQTWVASQLEAGVAKVDSREFDRTLLKTKGKARRAKESVKTRLETAEDNAVDASALLEMARGSLPRDREWALQQLAKRTMAGEEIQGVSVEK